MVHYRKPDDRRSRAQRWRDAVAKLVTVQANYKAWLDGLPDSWDASPTADRLRAVCDLDLSELEGIDLPRAFGRGLKSAQQTS